MMKFMSGNEAVAYAMKQIDPDVMGAFPITPSTDIPEVFADYVANGGSTPNTWQSSPNTAPCRCASRPRRPAGVR